MALSFAAQLQAWANKTEQKLEDVDRAFKLELFNQVVRTTRVDTGRLRGNWQVTTGAPARGQLERFQKAGGLSSIEVAKIQPFSSTWLSNNLPYARIWEQRDGMVGGALAMARRALAKAVQDVS